MLSKILSFPFVVGALICLYLTWEVDGGWAIYIVPNVVAAAIIYVFSPQIDFWWYSKRVPEMNVQLRLILTKQHTFYMQLSEENQKRFRDRVVMYMMGNEFMPQKMESVPPDLQGMIASNIIQLTFGVKDYLMSDFEHIIVYPRPFPSPTYPKNFHTSEIFAEDRVILFAIEQLVPGTISPTKHYNIGLHEYIRVFIHMYPKSGLPELEESIWEKLEMISGWSKAHIFKHINRPDVHILPVSVCHFFVFPAKFKEVLPELYEQYKKIFNMDPVNIENPVVDAALLGDGV